MLSLITAAGLGVDAYVHWHLAPRFDSLTGAASPHFSQGELFRLEAVLAVIAILLVLLLTRYRLGALVALLIAAGGLGAVLLYAFIDVGGFGPVPDMYDPIWYTEKTISAIAEAVAAVAALCLLLTSGARGSRPERSPSRSDRVRQTGGNGPHR
jgi:lipoprotein signal peptidase